MKKTWGRIFRRKSITDQHLQDDYPTNSESDTDDILEDEQRRREWEHNLNKRESTADPVFSDRLSDNNWEYESEYNYSVESDGSIIDAYREKPFNESYQPYTARTSEKRTGHAMKDKLEPDDDVKIDRRHSLHHTNDENMENIMGVKSLSPVVERVREFEQNHGKRRASLAVPFPNAGDSRPSYATWNTSGKRKVRKQMKKRRRAKDVSSDLSDEDNHGYTVNLTMKDLNDLIKKNINSAVQSIVSETTKSYRRFSQADSLSTETETIFSGSSSHSTEIPTGLLKKQIHQQLDKDKLKGIIKNVVSKEASDIFQKTLNSSTIPTQIIPTIVESPPTPSQAPSIYLPRYDFSQLAPQYHNVPNLLTLPPPPPPPALPSPSVSFSIPNRGLSNELASYQQRRHSLVVPNQDDDAQSRFGNISALESDSNLNPYNMITGFQPGAMSRLQCRRHTLAALGGSDSNITSLVGDLDKFDKFNNALQLFQNTINKAESSKEGADKNDVSKPTDNNSANTNGNNSGCIAPLQGSGVVTLVQTIADQIAALSKKEKKPLEVGQIPMTSCAKGILVISNIVFLIAGGGLLALGVWMMMDPNVETYFDVLNVQQNSSPFKLICYALIALGAFGLLISMLGCCGALHQSKCLLTMFLIMVGVVTAMEVGLGVMVMISKDSPTAIPVFAAILSEMEENLRMQLKQSLIHYYMPDTLMGTAWDTVQIQLECCGAGGPDDYKLSRWTNETRPETDFPDTCCVLVSKDAEIPEPSNKLLCHFSTAGFFFKTGCFEKMIGWFQQNSVYIVGIGGGILTIEVLAFVAAFVICTKGKKNRQQSEANMTMNKY